MDAYTDKDWRDGIRKEQQDQMKRHVVQFLVGIVSTIEDVYVDGGHVMDVSMMIKHTAAEEELISRGYYE